MFALAEGHFSSQRCCSQTQSRNGLLKTIKHQSPQPGGLSFSLFPNSQSRRQGVGAHHGTEGGSRNSSRGPSWARGPRCCRVLPPFAHAWEWCSPARCCAVEGRRFCSLLPKGKGSSQQQRDSGFCQHAHTVLSIAPFLEMLETALKHTQVLSRNTNLLRFWVVLWALSVEFYSNAKGGRLTHSQSEIGSRNPVFWARLQLLSILVSIPKKFQQLPSA